MRKLTFLVLVVIIFVNIAKSQNVAKELCNPINTFPFYESFNDTVFPPTCWKNYENDGLDTVSIWKRVTAGTNPTCLPHNGEGMLLFDCWNYDAGKKAILATPALNIPTDTYQVDFWMYRDNGFSTNKDSVNVYVNSDTNLIGATLLGSIHRSNTLNPAEPLANQWYHYTFNLPVGSAGMNKYIIIEGVSDYGTNIFIDDIKISETPPCPLPNACNVTSVSGSTATIGWNSSGSAASWDVEYGVLGYSQGSGTTINTTTNPVTLTGLAILTNYSYYVRSNCGATDGSSEWSGPHFFTTVCDPVSIFPYTESFDDSITFIPTCWKNVQTGGTGITLRWTRLKVGATPSASTHSGAGMASFNCRTYATGTKAILVTPELNLTAKKHQIRFWMYRDNGYLGLSDSLNVYYNANPNTTGATLLGTVNRAYTFSPIEATANKWYQYSFDIPQEVALNSKYIIFEGNSKKGNSIYVDDLTIDTAANCLQPFALIAKSIADTGATLGWSSTGTTTSWNVEYGVGNFIKGTGTVLNTNADSLVLANLPQNTEYSFYVQANCNGSDELSSWAGPYYFKTLFSCPVPTALTVSNILDSSATISWIPGGTETSWNLECIINGAAQNTGTIIATNSNSYTIRGLTPNTSYNFYIQADCGGNDSSSTWASSSVFTTLCTPISSFPFIESFDGTTFPPACWLNKSSYLNYFWWGSTSGTSPTCLPHSGSGMAKFPTSNYFGYNASLITPAMNIPNDNYLVKFWMFRDDGLPQKDDYVSVYYNTTPFLDGDAVLLGTIHRLYSLAPAEAITNQWYEYTFCLPEGSAGNNRYIILNAYRSAGNNVYVDDVTVEEQPPCRHPLDLTITAITNTEATIGWTSRSGESSWNVEYGPLGFVKGTGTVISSNTNPTTLTGLNPSTNYSFYVQANCGGVEGMSIWTGPYSFKTSCQAIENFPFIESFDGVTFPPTCWTAINGNEVSYWTRITSNYLGMPSHTGAGILSLLVNYNLPNKRAILSTPPISLPSEGYELGFWLYRDLNEKEDSVNIYISNQPNTNNAILISSVHNKSTLSPSVNEPNQWYYYSFPFPAGSAGDYKYVVFEGVGVGGTKRIVIDDVQIYASPSCPKPTELSATAITSNSATLGWTSNGTESDWRIQYGESGFLLGTGTTTATHTNPMTLTGLNMGYQYSYYVKADCSATDTIGVWAGPKFYTTACDTISSFPFTESFSSPLSQCWFVSRGADLGTIIDWNPATTDGANGVVGPQNGTHFMKLNVSSYSSYQNNPYYLTTPKIKLDSTPKRVKYFYYLGKSGNKSNPLKVQVSANNGATWIDLYTHDTTNSVFSTSNALTGWKQNAVYLDAYLNQTVMLRYVANSNIIGYGSGFCNIGLDEFVVENTPDCQPPSSVNILNIRDTSVTLGWNSTQDQSSWIIEYGPTGFAQGSGITKTTSTNSCTIPGLTASTQYHYYIKSNCGFGLLSGWNGPYEFRTACPRVTNLSATNITNSTADLTWTSNGTETSWKIEYGNSGFATGTGVQIDATSNPATITGLSVSTSYSYYVKTMCSGSDTSNVWVGPYNFSTTCSPITNFPFVESFNDTTFAPSCWKNHQSAGTGSSYVWKRVTTGSSPTCPTHSGLGMAQFNSYTYPSYTKAILATSPLVFDTNYYQVSFWMYRDNGDPTRMDSINVFLNDNPNTSNATLLSSIHRVNTLTPVEGTVNNWYKYSYYLPKISSNNYNYIVFEATSLYGNNMFIDDIIIDKKTCPAPTNLSANSITDSSAILAWTPRGNETAWRIEYGLNGFAHGSGVTKDISSITDTINGLIYNSNYQFYVKSLCNGIDSLSDWAGPYSFKTSCAVATSLTVLNSQYDYAVMGWTSNQNNASNWIMEYGLSGFTLGTGTHPAMYPSSVSISPLLPNSSYDVYIQAYCSSGNGPWFGPVSFKTNCAPPSALTASNITKSTADLGWTAIGTVSSWNVEYGLTGFSKGTGTIINSSTNPYTLSGLSANTSYQYYVQTDCSDSLSLWAGPYEFTTLIYCQQPINVSDSTTSDNVFVSWTPSSTETSWEIEYGLNGFVQGSGTMISASTNQYSITGLNPNTSYQYYIRSTCGVEGNGIWIGPYSFMTLCNSITSLPFIESFDGEGFAPSCWSNIEIVATEPNTIWERMTAGDYPTCSPKSGLGMASFNSYNFHAGSKAILVTPPMNISNQNQVSFWMYRDNGFLDCPDSLNVYYSNNLSTIGSVLLGTIHRNQQFSPIESGAEQWHKYSFSLSDTISGSFKYVIFEAVSKYGNKIYIDDIIVDNKLCPIPYSLTANNLNFHSAHLEWTAGSSETAWDIEYGLAGFTIGSGTLVSVDSNSYNLTGLLAGTQYQYYARAKCGVDGTSYWAGPYDFTTIESCLRPDFIQVQEVYSTTAAINWAMTYDVDNFDIEYGPAGFSHGAGDSLSLNNHMVTLNSLIPDTDYEFYVRTDCGVDGNSNWRGPATFRTLELCPKPATLTATNITNNTANISWVSNGTETTWNIQYGNLGFTLGTGIMDTANSVQKMIAGLTANVNYDFYVQANCGGANGVSAWVGPYSFQTAACEPISSFPFTESFDDTLFAPFCWKNIHSYGNEPTNVWSRIDTGLYLENLPHTGSGMASFVNDPSSPYSEALLITPPLNIPDELYQVKFWIYRNNLVYGNAQVSVYYNNVPSTVGATLLGTINKSYGESPAEALPNMWYQYTFHLPAGSAGNARYIIFDGDNDSDLELVIDDITVNRQECPSPIALTATPSTATGEVLSWTPQGSESSWTVEYGLIGVGLGSGNTATSNDTSLFISGLTPSSNYWYYVRSNCSGDDSTSTWAGPFYFTTQDLCVAPSNIYESDVTNESAIIHWTANNGENAWTIVYRSIDETTDIVVNTNSNSYTITGLSENLYYAVYVYANCGDTDGNSHWAGPIYFKTKCNPITDFPFVENFNDTLQFLTSCWANYALGISTQSWAKSTVNTSTVVPYNGLGMAQYQNYGTGYQQSSIFSLPPLNLPSDYFELGFWIYRDDQNPGSSDFVNAYYNTSLDTAGATFLGTIHRNSSQSPAVSVPNSWYHYSFDLPVGSGGNLRYLFLKTVCDEGNIIYLDDIQVKLQTCEAPASLTTTSISSNGAILDWISEDTEAAWNLRYKKTTDATFNEILNTTIKPYPLTGLDSNTAYLWNIQAICNISSSDWSGENTFNTLNSTVGILDTDLDGLSVFSFNSQVNVINSDNVWINDILIFDLLGKEVARYAINSTDNVLINSNLSIGNYVVKVITETKVSNYKLFIK